MRAAPIKPEAAQGIVRHMEGAGGVNMRGASSQRKTAKGSPVNNDATKKY